MFCQLAVGMLCEVHTEFLETAGGKVFKEALVKKGGEAWAKEGGAEERFRFVAKLATEDYSTAFAKWLRDHDWADPENAKKWCVCEFCYDMMIISGLLDGKRNGCHDMLMCNLHEAARVFFSADGHRVKQDEMLSHLTSQSMMSNRVYDVVKRGCLAYKWTDGAKLLAKDIRFDAPPCGCMENDGIHELLVHLLKLFKLRTNRDIGQKAALLNAAARLKRQMPVKGHGSSHHRYRQNRPEFTAAVFSVIKHILKRQGEGQWGVRRGAGVSAASLLELKAALRPASQVGTMRLMLGVKGRKGGKRPDIKEQPQYKKSAISWDSTCFKTWVKSQHTRTQVKACQKAGCSKLFCDGAGHA